MDAEEYLLQEAVRMKRQEAVRMKRLLVGWLLREGGWDHDPGLVRETVEVTGESMTYAPNRAAVFRARAELTTGSH